MLIAEYVKQLNFISLISVARIVWLWLFLLEGSKLYWLKFNYFPGQVLNVAHT
jgi:hypothetical protein